MEVSRQPYDSSRESGTGNQACMEPVTGSQNLVALRNALLDRSSRQSLQKGTVSNASVPVKSGTNGYDTAWCVHVSEEK